MVTLDDGEVWRINRANAALILHKTPAEIDAMPDDDLADVLAIHSANDEISAWAHKRKSRK